MRFVILILISAAKLEPAPLGRPGVSDPGYNISVRLPIVTWQCQPACEAGRMPWRVKRVDHETRWIGAASPRRVEVPPSLEAMAGTATRPTFR
jgi:hypothetical protein